MSSRKILFLMSGSIAAFKACQVISRLVQDGNEVQVVATPSTFEFVGRMTLEGLTGKKVLSDIWEAGHAMDHIQLTRWADVATLCPASANTLARLAHGFADDLVSAMALAWPREKDFWIFPAMNSQMLAASATQENLATLSQHGFRVAPTQSGSLACGETGPGRLLEPEEILAHLSSPAAKGKILITGGATREPIDGVRFISNVSTGQTAATLCDLYRRRGWEVTYVHGVGANLPSSAVHRIEFESFTDLDEKLKQVLRAQDYSAVIHCAAVSDFSVKDAQPERKLSSSSELLVEFKRNFKILPRLKEYSLNKNAKIIGFKLTLNADENETLAAARALLSPAVDAVVANDWMQVRADRRQHPGYLVSQESVLRFQDLGELTESLAKVLEMGGTNDSLS